MFHLWRTTSSSQKVNLVLPVLSKSTENLAERGTVMVNRRSLMFCELARLGDRPLITFIDLLWALRSGIQTLLATVVIQA